jgi:hypothetical protein
VNFFDGKDPVADPLSHERDWAGGVLTPAPSALFNSQPPNVSSPTPSLISDVDVDNIGKSGGAGLQAHNYWDNVSQFITPLADQVKAVVEGGKCGGEEKEA